MTFFKTKHGPKCSASIGSLVLPWRVPPVTFFRRSIGKQDTTIEQAVAAANTAWKADKQVNAIFWDFIEQERNQILKEYDVGFLAGPIDVVAGGELHTLDEHLFCPIADGVFAGEDCRDILEQAITWWESQLNSIEAAVRAHA